MSSRSPSPISYSPSSPVYSNASHNSPEDIRIEDICVLTAADLTAKRTYEMIQEETTSKQKEADIISDDRLIFETCKKLIFLEISKRLFNVQGSIKIYGWDNLHYYKSCTRGIIDRFEASRRTNIPIRAFMNAKFKDGSDYTFRRLGLSPIFSDLKCYFLSKGYALVDISDLKVSSRWVCEISIASDDPIDLTCPILHQVMGDPVVASDGHTYERSAIGQVIQQSGVSPFTRQTLQTQLYPNLAMKRAIGEYEERKRHRSS